MYWQGCISLLTVACFLTYHGGACLRLMEVRIPKHTVREQSPNLECKFDLEGEELYSVKWYKDGKEFFRFLPKDKPPAQVFDLPGVAVELASSNESQVVLKPVSLASTGRYRCEVSAEAPSFQTVTDQGDMIVVALPEEGPKILGGRPRYQIGDSVRVNCTSGHSKPAAKLTWYINGEVADSSLLKGPETLFTGREGLETTILGLEFRVKPKHFKRGDMKLKCQATIESVYYKSNEESVEGEKPQKTPVLPVTADGQSDGTPSKSRADRVQATGRCAPLLPCAPLLAAVVLFAAQVSALQPAAAALR